MKGMFGGRMGWKNCDGQVFAAVWMAGALTERNVRIKSANSAFQYFVLQKVRLNIKCKP
jgi:hypothetical protein